VHASETNTLKDETVFSQRRAILRKRVILLKKHSTRWRSLESARSIVCLTPRVGFCLLWAVVPRSSAMNLRKWSASYAASAITCPTPVSPSIKPRARGQSPHWTHCTAGDAYITERGRDRDADRQATRINSGVDFRG